MLRRGEIQIRDPYVLPDADAGRYYLFGTTDRNAWAGPGTGFDVYVGADLEQWDGPFPAFRPAADFWATTQFWAPEVHRHRGRYYLFATFKAPEVCRGTQVLVADSPLGPFVPHSDGPLTPRRWECLDGTLFIDAAGRPWLVFCHEWLQIGDGAMYATRLRDDLSGTEGECRLLFRASQAPWARGFAREGAGPGDCFITDGPFVQDASDGSLLLLWSSMGEHGYAMGVARSTGGIAGPWLQSERALFAQDGGHGMLFRALDGRLMLTLHAPNRTPDERPVFLPVRESGGVLSVDA